MVLTFHVYGSEDGNNCYFKYKYLVFIPRLKVLIIICVSEVMLICTGIGPCCKVVYCGFTCFKARVYLHVVRY